MYSLTCFANTSRLAQTESNWAGEYSVVKEAGHEGAVGSGVRVLMRARHSRAADQSPAAIFCSRSTNTEQVEGVETGGGAGLL